MKYFLFTNKDFIYFFKAENKESAYNKIINTFDLSGEPNYFEIESINNGTFTTKSNLFNLRIKKYFKLISTSENCFIFSKTPIYSESITNKNIYNSDVKNIIEQINNLDEVGLNKLCEAYCIEFSSINNNQTKDNFYHKLQFDIKNFASLIVDTTPKLIGEILDFKVLLFN